jgi:CHASE3 domain sensor protein
MHWLYKFSRTTVVVSLVVAFIALQSIAAAGFLSLLHFRSATQGVSHTQQVLLELESFVNSLMTVETGQRGYVLTGAEQYLSPYRESLNTIQQHVRRLGDLTRDNPVQQQRVAHLENQVDERLNEIGQVIVARHTDGLQAARDLVLTHHNRQTMDSIQQTVTQMRDQELRHLQARSEDSTTWALTAGAFSVVLFLFMFTIFGFSIALSVLALNTHRQAQDVLGSLPNHTASSSLQ